MGENPHSEPELGCRSSNHGLGINASQNEGVERHILSASLEDTFVCQCILCPVRFPAAACRQDELTGCNPDVPTSQNLQHAAVDLKVNIP